MAGQASRLLGTLRTTRLARHPVAPILLAAVALAVIGLLLPPRSTDGAAGPGLGGGGSDAPLAPPEDLADFRTMSRWGTNIAMVEDPRTNPTPNRHRGSIPYSSNSASSACPAAPTRSRSC